MPQYPLGVSRLMCCGWREIYALNSYAGDLNIALRSLRDNGAIHSDGIGAGAFLFTQAGTRVSYGKKFAKDIAKHELGEVIAMPKFTNPNTSRVIQAFMWIPDKKKVFAYCKKHKILGPERQ
jgi:hypothetical protein